MMGLMGEEDEARTRGASQMGGFAESPVDLITSNGTSKENRGRKESAFSKAWLPSNRRAITYMLYKKLTEEYLRNTLLRLRASDETIEKAVKDLRKLKTLTPEHEIELKERGVDSLMVHGDGFGVKGLSPFVFTPLHRCDGKTSVHVDRVILLGEVIEDRSTGDSEWKPSRNIVMELVDDGTKLDSNTLCFEESVQNGRDTKLSPFILESWVNKGDDVRDTTLGATGHHLKTRRSSTSKLPKIIGRIGRIFRRRSAIN